ncbi:MAG TPA: hypothetical protein VF950_07020 [Planctomycetota bacterium]
MKAILTAFAALAAGALTQERDPAEACEVRIWLIDQNGNPAPLRHVAASIVVPGKAGTPDRSSPMIIEVPLKSDAPRGDAKPARPQSAKVEGTTFTAEAMVFKHVPAAERKPGDPEPAAPREGPYFRAILDRNLLGEEGAFRIVFTLDGDKRVAKGFSCHFEGAKARKYYQDLERAVAVKDAERAKAALARLRAELAKMPAGDPHRDVCARAREDVAVAIDVQDWDLASRGLASCREACAECAEKCAPAPSDERRRP